MRSVLHLLILVIAVAALAGGALGAEPAAPAGPEIRDPLYAFIIAATEADSLGSWSQADLRRHVEQTGRPTSLPLDRIRRISRHPAAASELESRRGGTVTRNWEVLLDRDLRLPMPYSILGYHPGNLLISRRLRFSEWRLGTRNIYVAAGDSVTIKPATAITAYRLDEGWVVLDVAALLDRFLGKKLDDSWTVGFAVCRVEGELYGLGLGYGRNRRKLFGEIDFRTDEILTHGRPVAQGISRFVRPWMAPPAGTAERIWQYNR